MGNIRAHVQFFYHYNPKSQNLGQDYERLFISNIHTRPGGTNAKYAKQADL